MIIKELELKNYRNYESLNIELDSKLNIFVGNNAQGKSNILESIFVLALTKSYMNIKDQNLIKDGASYAFIKANFLSFKKEDTYSISIGNGIKKLKINKNEIKKYSDYVSRIKVLIFSPYNVNFIKDGPGVRRKDINMVISQISNSYVKLLQNYNAILKKRNQFLKINQVITSSNKVYFDILNEKFISLAVDIIKKRYDFIFMVSKYLSSIYKEITLDDGLSFNYVCSIDYNFDRDVMISDFRKKLMSYLEREQMYGMTLIGPHRDDFLFLLKNKDLSIYGSQGQIRVAILALKLAEVLIFKDNFDEYPILLLDDIFSELDIEKRNKLVKYILDDVQTIITTTDIDMIDEELIRKSKVFSVSNGSVTIRGKKECNNE